MVRSVTDAAIVLSVIAGVDPNDNFTLAQPHPVPDYTKALPQDHGTYLLKPLTDNQKQEASRASVTQMKISSHTGTIPTETPQSPQYPRKVHYRIVFEQVGIPLHKVTSLHDIFWALMYICDGAFFVC